MKTHMIYVTYPNREEAARISKTIVEQRLAACANMFQPHDSLYWWDGAVQSAQEVAVIYKTTQKNVDALRDKILSLHSYKCPCIVAIPIEKGHDAFLRWIEDETQ